MARLRKRDILAHFFLDNWNLFSKINFFCSGLFVLFILLHILLDGWSFFSGRFFSVFLLWAASEIVVLFFSVYVAKRYVFVTSQNKKGKLQLVMIRRPEEMENVKKKIKKLITCSAPQVVRWDFAGVFFSNLFGKINSIPLFPFLRAPCYKLFSFIFSVNLSECSEPLTSYRCMQDFFGRKLKEGVRTISNAKLVSPVDGKVVSFGEINSDQVEQVKGVCYSVSQFLGQDVVNSFNEVVSPGLDTTLSRNKKDRFHLDEERANNTIGQVLDDLDETLDVSFDLDDDRDDNGNVGPAVVKSFHRKVEVMTDLTKRKLYHMVIYLAPGDYHRIHAPADFSVNTLKHFPGTLFRIVLNFSYLHILAISPLVARLIPNLFALNERVVLSGNWEFGYFSLTAVGAYNVGSMTFNFDDRVKTNRLRRDFQNPNLSFGGCGCYAYDVEYKDSVKLTKGLELGRFNLGSTVVMIFDAPAEFQFTVTSGQKVKLGEQLGF